MYYEGQGVPQDLVQAHMWYNVAAWLLPPEESNKALASRVNVESDMTPAQIAEAEKLAHEWLEKHQKAD
jgi:TPR repeat protein